MTSAYIQPLNMRQVSLLQRTRVTAFSLLLVGSAAACAPERTGLVHIVVDPAEHHQTMTGWEATAQGGQWSSAYPRFRDTLLALAVNDLGINRMRLEVRSGVEQTRDYLRDRRHGLLSGEDARCARYETVNDNDDPRLIDPRGFQFTELDETIDTLVLPLQRALAARGRKLLLAVTYVAFFRQCPRDRRYDHRSADEYAEFVLATVLHMRDRYQLVPDLWEIILEPDNTDDWSGTAIGEAIVASAARLSEHGIRLRFVGPSNTSMAGAVRYYDAMVAVPKVTPLLAEFSYHRYRGVSPGVLAGIAERARRDTVATSMLEHIGSGVDDLLDDLLVGHASAWSQYALAIDTDGPDDGGLYYRVDVSDSLHPVVREGERTRFLRQVFRAAPLGAVRIGATSDDPKTRPVAFRIPAGGLAVAIRTMRSTDLLVTGLAPGRYTITFATRNVAHGTLPDSLVTAGGALRVVMPSAGVLTLIAR